MDGNMKYVAKQWRKRVETWEKQVRELSYWLLHDVDEEEGEEGDNWWDTGFDGGLGGESGDEELDDEDEGEDAEGSHLLEPGEGRKGLDSRHRKRAAWAMTEEPTGSEELDFPWRFKRPEWTDSD